MRALLEIICFAVAVVTVGCVHRQSSPAPAVADVTQRVETEFQADLAADKLRLQGVSDLRTGVPEWPGMEDPAFEALIRRFEKGRRLHSITDTPSSSPRGVAWMAEQRAFCRAYNARLKKYLEDKAKEEAGEPSSPSNAG